MVKGTRILFGDEAEQEIAVKAQLRSICGSAGFRFVSFPNISEYDVFKQKADESTMYVFRDKAERELCLNPEITALAQREFKESWSKNMPKPLKIMYMQKCYRYDRPQAGRYREFTQFGIEIMGGKAPYDKEDAISLLKACLDSFKVPYTFNNSVKRGLGYYVEDGFEAEVESLGAQKQIAGGGRYDCGIGWAIGVERLILTKKDVS
jgi:histidyl-tRNA synthetase